MSRLTKGEGVTSKNPDGSSFITLPVANIAVTLNANGGGYITSDLKEEPDDNTRDDEEGMMNMAFNAAMDGLESMILAHACAGIDIATEAYVEGIEHAHESCENNVCRLGEL